MKGLFSRTLALGRDLLFRPARAFEAFEREDASLPEALLIYAAFCLSNAVFIYSKPADFPAMMAESGFEKHSFLYWLGLELPESFFFVLWFVAFLAFLGIARRGRIAARVLALFVWVAVWGAVVFLYGRHKLDAWAFALASLVSGGFMGWRAFRDALPHRRILSLFTAANVILIFGDLILGLVAWFRWDEAYVPLTVLLVIWSMLVTAWGIKRFADIAVPRTFFSIFFSFFVSFILLYTAFLCGLISPETLSALMRP